MKKYQIYSSFILVILFIANTTSAQFNYGAKKKPATAGKDSTIAPTVAAVDTTKKAVAFSAKYISCKKCHSRSGITSDFGFLLETYWKPVENLLETSGNLLEISGKQP